MRRWRAADGTIEKPATACSRQPSSMPTPRVGIATAQAVERRSGARECVHRQQKNGISAQGCASDLGRSTGVHGKAFIWQQPQPSAETTAVTDATPGRDPRPSTPHRAASCARAAALRSIVPSSPVAVGRSHGRGWLVVWLVVWLVAFLFASVAPLRPSFPCMLLVPPSDDSIQNLNPGQDTRQQTAKRTHERRHEGTHTRRRTPAQTNQPANQPHTQPTNQTPPPVTHTLSARARRPAGSAPARAPLTDSSVRPPGPPAAAPWRCDLPLAPISSMTLVSVSASISRVCPVLVETFVFFRFRFGRNLQVLVQLA